MTEGYKGKLDPRIRDGVSSKVRENPNFQKAEAILGWLEMDTSATIGDAWAVVGWAIFLLKLNTQCQATLEAEKLMAEDALNRMDELQRVRVAK